MDLKVASVVAVPESSVVLSVADAVYGTFRSTVEYESW
jgi:hypothetical protein